MLPVKTQRRHGRAWDGDVAWNGDAARGTANRGLQTSTWRGRQARRRADALRRAADASAGIPSRYQAPFQQTCTPQPASALDVRACKRMLPAAVPRRFRTWAVRQNICNMVDTSTTE